MVREMTGKYLHNFSSSEKEKTPFDELSEIELTILPSDNAKGKSQFSKLNKTLETLSFEAINKHKYFCRSAEKLQKRSINTCA